MSPTYAITHATNIGYDLQTSLLLSAQSGLPLAPVALRLVNAAGSYTTYGNSDLAQSPFRNPLDEVSDCIHYLEHQSFSKPLVHVIDREGDSIGPIRGWEQADYHWLVRAKDNPMVDYQGQAMACKAVAQTLNYQKVREVTYHGKSQWQWIAQTDVCLSRPAKPSQKKSKARSTGYTGHGPTSRQSCLIGNRRSPGGMVVTHQCDRH